MNHYISTVIEVVQELRTWVIIGLVWALHKLKSDIIPDFIATYKRVIEEQKIHEAQLAHEAFMAKKKEGAEDRATVISKPLKDAINL